MSWDGHSASAYRSRGSNSGRKGSAEVCGVDKRTDVLKWSPWASDKAVGDQSRALGLWCWCGEGAGSRRLSSSQPDLRPDDEKWICSAPWAPAFIKHEPTPKHGDSGTVEAQPCPPQGGCCPPPQLEGRRLEAAAQEAGGRGRGRGPTTRRRPGVGGRLSCQLETPPVSSVRSGRLRATPPGVGRGGPAQTPRGPDSPASHFVFPPLAFLIYPDALVSLPGLPKASAEGSGDG